MRRPDWYLSLTQCESVQPERSFTRLLKIKAYRSHPVNRGVIWSCRCVTNCPQRTLAFSFNFSVPDTNDDDLRIGIQSHKFVVHFQRREGIVFRWAFRSRRHARIFDDQRVRSCIGSQQSFPQVTDHFRRISQVSPCLRIRNTVTAETHNKAVNRSCCKAIQHFFSSHFESK